MRNTTTETRLLTVIANEIRRDWGVKLSPHARPYLDAMATLSSVEDNYMFDSGRSIVNYFLANATTWRGEKARKIKAELKGMVKR